MSHMPVSGADERREIPPSRALMFNPLTSDHTPIGALAAQLRLNLAPADIDRSAPVGGYAPIEIPAEEARPFLTVLTRTQGNRPDTLREVLLSLAAQTCQDFELLIVAHKVPEGNRRALEGLVDEVIDDLRKRVRIVYCDHGNRTTPLNVGFAAAKGFYISILDDDDIIFANWVEEFKKCAEHAPGRIIRAVCATQEVDRETWGVSHPGFRSVSGIRKAYPSEHDFFAHLIQNFSPSLALAIPSYPFREMGLRFDETLNTAEDWDFETRCGFICGVESTPEITCVYRRWRTGVSSATLHSEEEWKADYDRIVAKNNETYHIFPPGTIKLLQSHQQLIRKLEADVAELQGALASANSIILMLKRYPHLYGFLSRGWRLIKKVRARFKIAM